MTRTSFRPTTVIFGRHSMKVPGLFQHRTMWRSAQSTLKEYMRALVNPVSGAHPLFGLWSPSVGRIILSSEEACGQLNSPLTMEELAQCIKSAKCENAEL